MHHGQQKHPEEWACKIQQNSLRKGSPYGISVSSIRTRLWTPSLRRPFPRLLRKHRKKKLIRRTFQETTKDPEVEGSRSYQSSVTPLLQGHQSSQTLVLVCFGATREGRIICDRSLLTSWTLDFFVLYRFLSDCNNFAWSINYAKEISENCFRELRKCRVTQHGRVWIPAAANYAKQFLGK